MSFQERLNSAVRFEDAVVDRLTSSGWRAFHFGQAQLPPECRDLLIRYEDGAHRPCLIRWMPDVIAFRAFAGTRTYVALIDAKVCGDRPNYAVEMSAVEAASVFTDQLYTPTFFVFDDWRVMTPREVRQRGTAGPIPAAGRGSGTPYLLVSKQFGRPFGEFFPPVAGAA